MEFTICNLEPADIEAADQVARLAFRNPESRAEEIYRYLEFQPDGWFIAKQADVVLGMVGAVNYGSFAYIGLMVVRPELQGRGIGKRLMERLLCWLDQQGTPALLDATEMGYPLYKKLGFIQTDLGCVYIQDQKVEITASDNRVQKIQLANLDELAAFDAPLFGSDRKRVLGILLRDYPGRAIATRDKAGQITGYLFVRDNRLGPWMASEPAAAEALLQTALAWSLPAKPVVIIPGSNMTGRRLLELYGFRFKRSCRHMERGAAPLRQRAQIFGQASFAIG